MTKRSLRIVLSVAGFVVVWNWFPMIVGQNTSSIHHIQEASLTALVSMVFLGGLIVGLFIGAIDK